MRKHAAKYAAFSRAQTLVTLGTLVVLAVGSIWYLNSRKNSTVTYQTAEVTRGDITQAVTATGTLNPVLNVQVGSQISGIILKLFADFNTPVTAGQIVAQLDPATYQASVTQAEGDLANAKAALELANINAERAKALRAQNAAPQSNLDQAMASLHQAEAQVKIKEGALARAKVDFERCTIYSPVDGIVISRSVDVGQTVAASLQAPVLFTIANDLTKMQIDANVSEADVGNVEVGQDVDFTVDAFPTRTFHGKVAQVRNAPITVQNVVTYDTVVSVSNDDLKLKPGMTANISIIVAHHENVLKLTNAALRFRMPETAKAETSPAAAPQAGGGGAGGGGGRGGGGRAGGGPGGPRPGMARAERRPERTVYVLYPGKEQPQPAQIKTGISDGIFTEVTEGLSENEQVVIGSTGGETAARAQQAPNPLSGGMRRF
jgi:HlyD family secretion protein